MKIYLAGKVTKNCWRDTLLGWRFRSICGDFDAWREWAHRGEWPVSAGLVLGKHDYTGPYPLSCDHGCAHGDGTHGAGATGSWYHGEERESPADDSRGLVCTGVSVSRTRLSQLCLDAIDRSDLVFAWLDETNCHGTLVEIGYARGVNVPVVVAAPDAILSELWFAREAGGVMDGAAPREALENALTSTHVLEDVRRRRLERAAVGRGLPAVSARLSVRSKPRPAANLRRPR